MEEPLVQEETAAPSEAVGVAYENQRFYGYYWGPPARIERPPWSDAAGNSLPLAEEELPAAAPVSWELVITSSTDAQGWEYSTMFAHLDYKRPGGRASRRLTDLVRRRAWRRRQLTSGTTAMAAAAGASTTLPPTCAPALESQRGSVRGPEQQQQQQQQQGGASPPETGDSGAAGSSSSNAPATTQEQALALVRAMRASLRARRRPWAVLPWGPPAVGELRRAHQAAYAQLEAAAKARPLLGPGAPPPPSRLHPWGSSRTLLEDLKAAAAHSRAVYGYCAAAGHMSSVRSFIRLCTLERLRFDAVGGASAEANEEAAAQLAGVGLGDILTSQWRSEALRPSHYVAIDRARECVVLAVRGSLEDGDWLSDACAHPVRARLCGREGWVHAGILEAARHLQAATRPALTVAAQHVPGWPLLLTGHSLGGGVAGVLALLLHEDGLPPGLGLLHCVTLGSAAVLSEPLAEAAEGVVTSVVIGADVVPRLSCASVEALMQEVSRTSPGRQAVQALNARLAKALGMREADALREEDFESWGALKQAGARMGRSIANAGLIGLLRSYQAWVESPPAAQQDQQQQQQQQQPPEQAAGPQQLGSPTGAEPPPLAAEVGPGSGDLSDDELAMLTELAVADAAAVELADSAAAPPQGSTAGGSGTEAAGAAAEEGGPALSAAAANSEQPGAHPELLYPPGRLLWLFPPDEPTSAGSLAAEAGSAAVGVAVGAAEAAVGSSELAASPSSCQAETAAQEGEGCGVPAVRAVAAEAQRACFDRLLLLPAMLSDHLPGRYVQALEML